MGVQDIVAAIPTAISGGSPSGDALRTALISGQIGFIDAATAVTAGVLQVDPVDASLGGVCPAYVYGRVGTFVYDSTDSTTAHDGIFVLVLIGGKRYKVIGLPQIGFIKSRTVTTPPGSPAFGDAYLYLTGTWGAVGITVNHIAVWSSLGGGSWQDVAPAYGPPLYIIDEDAYVHWAGGSGWLTGPNMSLGNASTVKISAIAGLKATPTLIVVNQTTNTPPVSPAIDDNYVIGSAPTGTWSGHAAGLAICEVAGSFTIYTPSNGDEVFDNSLSVKYRWNSTASKWQAVASGIAQIVDSGTAGDASAALGSTGAGHAGYALSATAPVQTVNGSLVLESITVPITADYAGQVVEVEYAATVSSAAAFFDSGGPPCDYLTVAVYIDSETNARDWRGGLVVPPSAAPTTGSPIAAALKLTLADTSAHTIKIALHPHGSFLVAGCGLTLIRRRLTARKRT
jgi:hypothetical protein